MNSQLSCILSCWDYRHVYYYTLLRVERLLVVRLAAIIVCVCDAAMQPGRGRGDMQPGRGRRGVMSNACKSARYSVRVNPALFLKTYQTPMAMSWIGHLPSVGVL